MIDTDWRTRRVSGIGIVGIDHVAVTDRWERDGKSTASHYFEQVGGPVPVALMGMARLGMETSPVFVGAVGSDAAANSVFWGMRESGVNVNRLSRRTGRTPVSVVVLNPTDGTRTLTNYPGTITEGMFVPDHAPARIFKDVGLLHTDGRETRWTRRIRELYGVVLSLDLGSPRETHKELLPHCDIIIASKNGGAGTFPDYSDDPAAQVTHFLEIGATIAGVTLGAEGVVIASRNENGGVPVHMPAYPVSPVLDTCGAGDLFHGAFLWAYRDGRTAIESAAFAQAAVALRIQQYGNVAGQPSRDQVDTFRSAL